MTQRGFQERSGRTYVRRTFCTLIRDPDADTVLVPYGALMASVRHRAFKQVHVLGRGVARSALEVRYRARQFNGVRFDLD